MSDGENPIDKFLGSIENQCQVEPFQNSRYAGIEIRWAAKGWGFGALNICYDLQENKWSADTESCGVKSLEKILHMAVPALAQKMLELDGPTPQGDGEG